MVVSLSRITKNYFFCEKNQENDSIIDSYLEMKNVLIKFKSEKK